MYCVTEVSESVRPSPIPLADRTCTFRTQASQPLQTPPSQSCCPARAADDTPRHVAATPRLLTQRRRRQNKGWRRGEIIRYPVLLLCHYRRPPPPKRRGQIAASPGKSPNTATGALVRRRRLASWNGKIAEKKRGKWCESFGSARGEGGRVVPKLKPCK